jgi:cation transport ATPase
MTPSYGPFRRIRDRFRARRDGRRDGLLGIPAADEVAHPPALLQIKQRGDEALAALFRRWAEQDARLRQQDARAQRAVSTADGDVHATAMQVVELEERAADSRTRRDEIAAETVTIAPGGRIGMRAYAVLIVAILFAEFPLNAIAFRLFGEAEVLTWVMTAGLAVTLVLCAHGLGSFLRVARPSMAERRWIVVLLTLPVLTIVAVAVLRARYLSLGSQPTSLDALGPVAGSLAFLAINLLVYTGATMLSYLAHAPRVAGEREAKRAADSAQRALSKAQEHLAETSRDARRHERQVAHAGVAVQETLRVAEARAAELIAYYGGLMSTYSAANLRARGNPQLPAVLRSLPSLDVPAALRSDETAPRAGATLDPVVAGNGRGVPR